MKWTWTGWRPRDRLWRTGCPSLETLGTTLGGGKDATEAAKGRDRDGDHSWLPPPSSEAGWELSLCDSQAVAQFQGCRISPESTKGWDDENFACHVFTIPYWCPTAQPGGRTMASLSRQLLSASFKRPWLPGSYPVDPLSEEDSSVNSSSCSVHSQVLRLYAVETTILSSQELLPRNIWQLSADSWWVLILYELSFDLSPHTWAPLLIASFQKWQKTVELALFLNHTLSCHFVVAFILCRCVLSVDTQIL